MYGNYSRRAAVESRIESEQRLVRSKWIAERIRESGGEVLSEELLKEFTASEIETASERFRTIYPVTRMVAGTLRHFYAAN